MNDYSQDVPVSAKPSKLIPVLIGGAAMVVIAEFPVLNLVNLACCAGVMGAAVLGVWFYKRSFPPDLPFHVGDGAAVGALAGVFGGTVSALITMFSIKLFSSDFVYQFQDKIDEAFANADTQGADPAALDAMQDAAQSLGTQPLLLAIIILLFFVLIYTGFGALGGVIGGNIFKTKIVPPAQMPPMQNNPGT